MKTIKYINIDENSRVPKYKQIVDSIIHNISNGNFQINDKIPSINAFSEEFYLSRDTVEKAYNILKKRRIIVSIKGKGNYVSKTELLLKNNVLFLVNKTSSYKMKIYNAFIDKLGMNYHTDMHIYHCDSNLFSNILVKNLGAYDYYAIMPHFKTADLAHTTTTEDAKKVIEKIPSEKLIIIDNLINLNNNPLQIYQDFENDIYHALISGLNKIKKYENLFLIFPEKSSYPYPKRILHGFRRFCETQFFNYEILNEVYKDMILKKGDLFIVIEESDLVRLIKQIRKNNLVLGKDVGIISYNDTPLKDLLGITVISTDFKKMGVTAAKMILKKEKGMIKNPFNYIDRKST